MDCFLTCILWKTGLEVCVPCVKSFVAKGICRRLICDKTWLEEKEFRFAYHVGHIFPWMQDYWYAEESEWFWATFPPDAISGVRNTDLGQMNAHSPSFSLPLFSLLFLFLFPLSSLLFSMQLHFLSSLTHFRNYSRYILVRPSPISLTYFIHHTSVVIRSCIVHYI